MPGADDVRDRPGIAVATPACDERVVDLPPTDLRRTLSALRVGAGDPCCRIDAGGWWWATRSPGGPVTLHLRAVAADRLHARAWGRGTAWALERVPVLAGAHDPVEDDPPMALPWLRDLQRRYATVRMAATHRVVDAAVVAILGQRVTGKEARQGWAALVRRLGAPAPGPARLLLPPEPARLAALPSWAMHPLGIDRRRAETIRRVAAVAHRLDRADLGLDVVRGRLAAVPGVGVWTVAETTALAFGDPDALPVGDYHAKHVVVHAFTGARRGTDEEMVALLAPYAGRRRRVLRWLELGGLGPPRVAPRQRILPLARF